MEKPIFDPKMGKKKVLNSSKWKKSSNNTILGGLELFWNICTNFLNWNFFFTFTDLSLQATCVHTNHQFFTTLQKVVEQKFSEFFQSFFLLWHGSKKVV